MNDSNPFQSPATASQRIDAVQDGWSAAEDERFAFQFQLTKKEVKRHFFEFQGFVIFSITWAALTLFIYVISQDFIIWKISLASGVPIIIGYWIDKMINYRKAIRQNRRLLESTTGYVDRKGVFTYSDNCQFYSYWKTLFKLDAKKEALLITSQVSLKTDLIIPWNAFENEGVAECVIRSVIQHRKFPNPVVFGNKQLLKIPEVTPLFQPPDHHVTFSGEILRGDVKNAAPIKALRRVVLLSCFAGALLAFAVLVILTPTLLCLICLTTISLILGPFWDFLYSNPFIGRKKTPILISQGWFYEQGLFVHDAEGQSHFQWDALGESWCNEKAICIRAHGTIKAWHFFVRSQFSSSEDFELARQWTQQRADPSPAEVLQAEKADGSP